MAVWVAVRTCPNGTRQSARNQLIQRSRRLEALHVAVVARLHLVHHLRDPVSDRRRANGSEIGGAYGVPMRSCVISSTVPARPVGDILRVELRDQRTNGLAVRDDCIMHLRPSHERWKQTGGVDDDGESECRFANT